MPTRTSWRFAAAWRRTRRPAAVAVAAAVLGVGGCSALQTPSAVGGKNTASRTLSPEQLREVAATFEAQGRTNRAERLFAVADRRAGQTPHRPGVAPQQFSPNGDATPPPPSPIPPAPTQLAAAPQRDLEEPTIAVVAAEESPTPSNGVSHADAVVTQPTLHAVPAEATPKADATAAPEWAGGDEWSPHSEVVEWEPIALPPRKEPAVRRVPVPGVATLDLSGAPSAPAAEPMHAAQPGVSTLDLSVDLLPATAEPSKPGTASLDLSPETPETPTAAVPPAESGVTPLFPDVIVAPSP